MYPYDFKPEQKAINFTEVFVVMPFEGKYDDIFNKLIDPATKKANEILNYAGHQALSAKRTKEDILTTSGWINVLEHLLTAQVVLGVLTDNNPNVFYELGIAHVAEPKTRQILIANKGYKRLFDTKDLIYYEYENYLQSSVEPLALRITEVIKSYKIAEEKKINLARMLIGPYEFEIVMLYNNTPNFVLHTSPQGRVDYEGILKVRQSKDYVEGAFERHVVAIRHLCQCGLLGLNTQTKESMVYFSYHWTELGNSVLHLMDLITIDELKKRRENLPSFFQ